MGDAKRKRSAFGPNAVAIAEYAPVELRWAVRNDMTAAEAPLAILEWTTARTAPSPSSPAIDPLRFRSEITPEIFTRIQEAKGKGNWIVFPEDVFDQLDVRNDGISGFQPSGTFYGLFFRETGPRIRYAIEIGTGRFLRENGVPVEDPVAEIGPLALVLGKRALPFRYGLTVALGAVVRLMEAGQRVDAFIQHLQAYAICARPVAIRHDGAAADLCAYIKATDDLDEFLHTPLGPQGSVILARDAVLDAVDVLPRGRGPRIYAELADEPISSWMPRDADPETDVWTDLASTLRGAVPNAPADFAEDAARTTVTLEVPQGRLMVDQSLRPWMAERAEHVIRLGPSTILLARDADTRFLVIESGDNYEMVTWSVSGEVPPPPREEFVPNPDGDPDYTDLLDDVEQVVKQGLWEAADSLPEVLEEGSSEERRRAVAILSVAAPHNVMAKLNYAIALLLGDAVRRDTARGARLMEEVLDQIDVPRIRIMALNWLGDYHLGRLITGDDPIDPARALRYRREAASLGDGSAACSAGFQLEIGDGVPVDLRAAERCYRLAVSLGDVPALSSLAFMIMRGAAEGDADDVRSLLEDARDKGDLRGQNGLIILDRYDRDGEIDLGALRSDVSGAEGAAPDHIDPLRERLARFVPEDLARPRAVAAAIEHHFGVSAVEARAIVATMYGHSGWASLRGGVASEKPSPPDAEAAPETVALRHALQLQVLSGRIASVLPTAAVIRWRLDPTGTSRPTLRDI